MYRLIATEGKDVTTHTFCDEQGLETYLTINDLPMACAATMKELHDTGEVPEITIDGATIKITYRAC